jgi:hypothetical protein
MTRRSNRTSLLGSDGGSWNTFFIFQLAQSHLTRRLFGQILRRIERLTWRPI